MRLHFLISSHARTLGAMFFQDLQEDIFAFFYPQTAPRTFHTFFCPPLRILALSSQGCILFDEVLLKPRLVKLPACRYVIETGPNVDYRPFVQTILSVSPSLPQLGALEASVQRSASR
jgi:hypothetical protein